MERLYIQGVEIDLPNTPITRDIKGASVGDIAGFYSSASFSIKLPRTARNVAALEMIGVMGSVGRAPYKLLSAQYFIGNTQMLNDGRAVITGLSSGSIDITLLDGVISLSELLGEKTLLDLPLSELNHYLTPSNVVNSFSNTSGYTYAIADYGIAPNSSILQIEELYPSVYVSTIMQAIFASNGKTLGGGLLNSTDFNSELISLGQGYQVPFEQGERVKDGNILIDDYDYSRTTPTQQVFTIPIPWQVSGTFFENIDDTTVRVKGVFSGGLDLTLNWNPLFGDLFAIQIYKNGSLDFQQVLPTSAESVVVDYIGSFQVDDELKMSITARQRPNGLGQYFVRWRVDGVGDTFREIGGFLVEPHKYLPDVRQVDFITDVLTRYGGIIQLQGDTVTIDLLEDVLSLSNISKIEYIGNRFISLDSEKYTAPYAKNNYLRFGYPDSVVTPFGDGNLQVDNLNLSESADIYTSIYQLPSSVYNFSVGADIAVVPLIDLDNEPLELSPMLTKVESVEGDFSLRYYNSGAVAVDAIPILSTNGVLMQNYVDKYYRQFKSLMDDYKQVKLLAWLSPEDVQKIDATTLIAVEQTGQIYYVENIQYTAGERTTITALELNPIKFNTLNNG